jgi:dTMP kinase
MSGLFLSFEGTEGSGKTTQMRLLAHKLRTQGHSVVENQEPGTTRIGSKIRAILLDPEHREMEPMTELLLMFAARAQAAAEVIRPALARGEIVITDRFTDSTLAYQGVARGLGIERIAEVHRLALGDLVPDLTICISVDVSSGLARAQKRNDATPLQAAEARIDRQPRDFHDKVRQAYEEIAKSDPRRFRIIDGAGSVQAVAARVWAEVEPFILAYGERRSASLG